MRRLAAQAGITLIELLFSLGLLGFLGATAYHAVQADHRFYQIREDRLSGERAVYTALEWILSDLNRAGFGLVRPDPDCHPGLGEPLAIRPATWVVLGNLRSIQTVLTAPAPRGAGELTVLEDLWIRERGLPFSPAGAFQKNDIVYLSSPTDTGTSIQCLRLSRSGVSGRLSVEPGVLETDFPAGTRVDLINEVVYMIDETGRLTRRLDGGSAVVAQHLRAVELSRRGAVLEGRVVGQHSEVRFVLGPRNLAP